VAVSRQTGDIGDQCIPGARKRLKSVDLPTFGLPTITRVGFMTRIEERGIGSREQCTVPGLLSILKRDVHSRLLLLMRTGFRPASAPGAAVQPHKRRSDRAAVGSDTADEGAAFSRQEMHVSFDIATATSALEPKAR